MMDIPLDDIDDLEDSDDGSDPREALQQLCQANGIKDEDLKYPERITHIEMVLDDYNCMKTLKYFTGLRSVCLIQQAIAKIEGLEACTQLERLLLNENCIRDVRGLGSCSKLRQLYLCSNIIGEIGSGLSGLSDLEVLWIAENRLANLNGLELAPALTELNAARNHIASVVGAFNCNTRLRSLNLSDNRICSFREVLDLSQLGGLRELAFADPDWGENPICLLCHYSVYVLHHLPHLEVHDRLHISSEDHQAAAAAFSRKALYYGMRAKLAARQATDCLRAARAMREEFHAVLARALEAAARPCLRARALSQAAANPPMLQLAMPSVQDGPEDPASQAAVARLDELQGLADGAQTVWEALCAGVECEREAQQRGLQLELQTGGNVKLEAGRPGREEWAGQMESLVLSRFLAQDFARFGICGVQVRQVTRVHNRSLRILCDELLDRLEAEADLQFEYLFYVPDPGNALAELRTVAEEGLGAPCRQEELDEPGTGGETDTPAETTCRRPTLLTNSIAVAEAPRLDWHAGSEAGQAVVAMVERALQQRPWAGRPAEAVPAVSAGTLLICGAYLCDTQPGSPASFEAAGGCVRTAWAQGSARVGEPQGKTIYRFKSDDPNQKVWEPSQLDLVLPEYFVELEYIYSSSAPEPQKPEAELEFGPFNGILRDYTFYISHGTEALQSRDSSTDEAEVPSAWQQALPSIERLDLDTVLARENQVLAQADPPALQALRVMNLHGRGVRRVDQAALQPFAALQTLILSFNSIKSLSPLACPSLTQLDVSFNLIETVSALGSVPALRHFDISWNCLVSADIVSTLCRDVPELQVLGLRGNPVALEPKVRVMALARLRHLLQLDERAVSQDAVLRARGSDRPEAALTEELLCRCSSASCPPAGSPLRQSALQPLPGGHVAVPGPGWRASAEFLDLADLGLSRLCDLTGFSRLRRVRLSGNQLTSVEELAPCLCLEELSIEGNQLSSLRGLAGLSHLNKLDAGSNLISDVLDLQHLTKLCKLSLEDNHVDSLDTFSMLHSIVELYLSNNLIEDVRSVLLLKHLPKLLVMDLSGNELCSAAEYRQYTVFHLRRLKVLDGATVSQVEHQAAAEKFSGKITMELLEEKLGPSPSCYNLRSVDLSNLNIRELGNLLNDDIFPSLRELTLDGNPFSEMTTLGPLSKMLVLRMNRSKIDLEKGMLGNTDASGGVASLSHLQVLELGYSGIADISHFAQFPINSLRILHLPGNDISRVEGLSHFEQLRELVLDKNRIKQFDEHSFEGLRSLRELRLEDNGLKTLTHLGPLPRLRALYLSVNRVAELSELEKLRSLRHVLLINLSSNPVARKPLYRTHIISAVGSVRAIDGKEVTADERDKVEQLMQATDPAKQPGQGLYYFTEQAGQNPAAPSSYIVPPVASLVGASADAPPRQPGVGGVQQAPDRPRQHMQEPVNRAASAQPHPGQGILMSGQGFGEQSVPSDGAGLQRRPGDGAGGAEAVAAARRAPAARSHSVPRHIGLDYRPGAMPPSSGR